MKVNELWMKELYVMPKVRLPPCLPAGRDGQASAKGMAMPPTG